ncbi:MAG: Gfo/Idh/MocA family oxidoreductase [Planctomycetaceae bacterium]|nr:Gfo/Idh/MocA family oxidoreductase [Planctomycetaceae bacterium]
MKYSTRRDFLTASTVLTTAALAGVSAFAQESAKQWKIAIVKDTAKPGLGGHGLDRAFRGIPNIEVTALVDSNPKDIEKKLESTQAKRHYLTIDAMLQDVKPDIVILTERLPGPHLEQIRQVAEKGCHVYCEKPLTAFLEEADEIVKISEEKKIKIAMAHPCRNALRFVMMKKLIGEGKIGIPLVIHGWGKSDHRGGGEDMMTLGTHIFDLMIFLFGVPETVTADVRTKGEPFVGPELNKTVEDVGPAAGDEIFATFRFPGGVRGTFDSRLNLYKGNANQFGVLVTGSTGTLSSRFADGTSAAQALRFEHYPNSPENINFHEDIPLEEFRSVPGAEPLVFSGSPIFVEAGRYAFWDLMQCILEDRQPITNIYDARSALEMIYAVYTSHLAKTTIELPLQDRRHPLRDFKRPE